MEEIQYEKIFQHVLPALEAKVGEYQFYNYNGITEKDLWKHCVTKRWRKQSVETMRLHEIVATIMAVPPSEIFSYEQIDEFKLVDWFSEENKDQLQSLLKSDPSKTEQRAESMQSELPLMESQQQVAVAIDRELVIEAEETQTKNSLLSQPVSQVNEQLTQSSVKLETNRVTEPPPLPNMPIMQQEMEQVDTNLEQQTFSHTDTPPHSFMADESTDWWQLPTEEIPLVTNEKTGQWWETSEPVKQQQPEQVIMQPTDWWEVPTESPVKQSKAMDPVTEQTKEWWEVSSTEEKQAEQVSATDWWATPNVVEEPSATEVPIASSGEWWEIPTDSPFSPVESPKAMDPVTEQTEEWWEVSSTEEKQAEQVSATDWWATPNVVEEPSATEVPIASSGEWWEIPTDSPVPPVESPKAMEPVTEQTGEWWEVSSTEEKQAEQVSATDWWATPNVIEEPSATEVPIASSGEWWEVPTDSPLESSKEAEPIIEQTGEWWEVSFNDDKLADEEMTIDSWDVPKTTEELTEQSAFVQDELDTPSPKLLLNLQLTADNEQNTTFNDNEQASIYLQSMYHPNNHHLETEMMANSQQTTKEINQNSTPPLATQYPKKEEWFSDLNPEEIQFLLGPNYSTKQDFNQNK